VGVAAGKDFVLILIKSTDAQRLNLKSFDCPNLFFTRPLSLLVSISFGRGFGIFGILIVAVALGLICGSLVQPLKSWFPCFP